MQRVNDDENRQQLQREGDDMVAADLLVQQKIGQHGHKNGVAGKDDGDDGRLGVGHRHLVEHHRERHAQKARERKEAGVGAGEGRTLFLHRAQGKGNEQETADKKAQAGDLHGREDAVNGFEHDLHRAEDDGAEDNLEIAGIGALHRFPSFQKYGNTDEKKYTAKAEELQAGA